MVFEDERTMAFLDTRPLFHGHALLIPRDHHETLADLPAELLEPLFANASSSRARSPRRWRSRARSSRSTTSSARASPTSTSTSCPRVKKDGLRGFFWPRTKYESEAEAEKAANAIRKALRSLADRRRSLTGPPRGPGSAEPSLRTRSGIEGKAQCFGLFWRGEQVALRRRRDAVGVEDRLDVPKARDALLQLLGVADLDDEAVLDHRVLGRCTWPRGCSGRPRRRCARGPRAGGSGPRRRPGARRGMRPRCRRPRRPR